MLGSGTSRQADMVEVKPGYLYVLVHPSDPDLYKIGVTTKTPEERLAKHNSVYTELTGQTVKETGQKWELKTYIEVEDHYFAEKAFWAATYLADIPFRGGVEAYRMEWSEVLKGLEAAKGAGVRPSHHPTTWVRNSEWMLKQLEGTGITFERYRGLIRVRISGVRIHGISGLSCPP
jgi:hypothetical protein